MFKEPVDKIIEVGGVSVTQLINYVVKQPRGGLLPVRKFEKTSLGPGIEELPQGENISPVSVGLAVDYLSRYDATGDAAEAFRVSLKGSVKADMFDVGLELLGRINGIDDESVVAALKLVSFDVWMRAGGYGFVEPSQIEPNEASIVAVQMMVERCRAFEAKYGPVVDSGMTFKGGYTKVVSKGDADFLTADTLWDMKVLKSSYKTAHTLQLLMYWRMGLRSIHREKWEPVRYLGIFNPRKNEVLRIHVDEIPDETIRVVEEELLGYPDYLLEA